MGAADASGRTMQTWCAVIQQLYLSERLLAYRAPAVRARRAAAAAPGALNCFSPATASWVSGVLATCLSPISGHAPQLLGYQLPVVVGVVPTAPATRRGSRPRRGCR